MAGLYKRWPRVVDRARDAEEGPSGSSTRNPLAGSSSPISSEAGNASAGTDSLADEARIFRGVDRMKLIHMIISYGGEGGCGLDPPQLLKDECLLAYSPLHDMVELMSLESQWLQFAQWPWHQPVDAVKDYFGEKIGLYFCWLGVYTSWLIVAAVVGGCMWIGVAAEGMFHVRRL